MEDIHRIGGVPAILKYLLNHTDLIDGSQLTVTGKTLAQNLEDVPELDFTQDVIRKLDNPIKPTGHLTILRGNLAPGSSVAKLTGKEGGRFEVNLYFLYTSYNWTICRARPSVSTRKERAKRKVSLIYLWCSVEAFYPALEAGEIKPGTVLIFRYQGSSNHVVFASVKLISTISLQGPRGAPGMPEMLGISPKAQTPLQFFTIYPRSDGDNRRGRTSKLYRAHYRWAVQRGVERVYNWPRGS